MEYIEGGVCLAKGFKAAGLHVGIKPGTTKKDMAMIFSEKSCVAAGTFTSNLVKAAPVLWDRKTIDESEGIRGIVINSGIANACTGETGLEYCKESAKEFSKVSGAEVNEILLASTGVIGMQLPILKIKEGIGKLYPVLSEDSNGAGDAAEAIMTTDTVPKQAGVKEFIGNKEIHIGGMCKGSGMIHINMCTMLGFITTDVNITKELLTKALKSAVNDTFNMVSVDGDTSTNDSVIVLANGMAENDLIDKEDENYEKFRYALYKVCKALAKKIAGDGEGATKLFEVMVVNAKSKEDAVTLSKSIVSSNLTKCAIYGNDANWGRVVCAMGYSGVEFDLNKLDVYFESESGKIKIVEKGVATDYSEEEATKILDNKAVSVICDLNEGEGMATAWGCDLTHEYISINADYRS